MNRLIQIVPTHHIRDATGSEVRYIESLFRSLGWQADTFAEQWDAELSSVTRSINDLEIDDPENTIALYHFAVHSAVSKQFAELPCKRAMIYHNVTPAGFFRPFNRELEEICRVSRKEAAWLADHTELAIAHSDYSRRELDEMGYRVTRTIPFLLAPDRTEMAPDETMLSRLSDRPNALFVGRLVPNKAPDDFVRVAAAYHQDSGPDLRFVLVGKRPDLPAFTDMFDRVVENAGLSEEQLLITGEVSDAELMACYRSADLFLSMSRHEGFCVPVLEAMRFGLPVMARAAAAVPETVGDAGLLFNTTDHRVVAASVERLLADEELQDQLLRRSQRRLTHFDIERWTFVLRVLFETFAGE